MTNKVIEFMFPERKQPDKNMKIGIEIEGIYNQEIVGRIQKGYHKDPKNFVVEGDTTASEVWMAESDASVKCSSDREFIHPDSVEIISKPIKGKKKFFEGLDELKQLLTKGKNHELHKVLKFNKSCGCHIHFSFDDLKLNKICGYQPLEKIRKYFFKELLKLEISSEAKIAIKKH